MTVHDRLCLNKHLSLDECNCNLIKTVREDERWSNALIILNYAEQTHENHSPEYSCIRCDIVAAYRNAAAMIRRENRNA